MLTRKAVRSDMIPTLPADDGSYGVFDALVVAAEAFRDRKIPSLSGSEVMDEMGRKNSLHRLSPKT